MQGQAAQTDARGATGDPDGDVLAAHAEDPAAIAAILTSIEDGLSAPLSDQIRPLLRERLLEAAQASVLGKPSLVPDGTEPAIVFTPVRPSARGGTRGSR